MQDLNQQPILHTQTQTMTKPKRHSSKLIRAIQEKRNPAEFEKLKKRMLLAVKIQDAIKAKGLTNKQFAQLMDQHDSVISKWVSGTHNFTADTLFDIEDKLSINLIAVSESVQPVIVKHYYAVIPVSNQVTSPRMKKSTNLIADKKGEIHITATALGDKQYLGLPLFNTKKYDC